MQLKAKYKACALLTRSYYNSQWNPYIYVTNGVKKNKQLSIKKNQTVWLTSVKENIPSNDDTKICQYRIGWSELKTDCII